MSLISSKRVFVFFAILALSLSHAKQKNVLFIVVDDLRPELNCYGADYIHSPNIDNLAKQGVLFERAYVQQPVCTASRASFLTGLRPDSTGSDYPYSIYTVEELLEGNRPSVMRHFMNQGYYVRSVGKIHHVYNEDFTEKSVSAGWGTKYVKFSKGMKKVNFHRMNVRMWKMMLMMMAKIP